MDTTRTYASKNMEQTPDWGPHSKLFRKESPKCPISFSYFERGKSGKILLSLDNRIHKNKEQIVEMILKDLYKEF